MKKFIYFLTGSPNFPNEIYASSIDEVKKLILESVPSESQILKIIEVKENGAKDEIAEEDPNDFKNGNDFFNAVLNAGLKKAKAIKKEESQLKEVEKPQQTVSSVVTTAEPVIVEERIPVGLTDEPKYFEEAGIQFKLQHGKVYKKTWMNVTDTELPDFRIISKSSNKPVSLDKYKIEKLEWVEI